MATVRNPLETFVWGAGGQAMSPEQVARQREIAAAMMNTGMDYSPVSHWLEGAARAAQGGVGALKERWANEAEAEGRQGFQSQWDSIIGGAGGSPVAAALAGGSSVPAIGGGASASIPGGDSASYIRSGLINRGLPEHVADGFLLNMQDESGLDPGINEAAPLVPGSRGGYGLYQLTGPRRRAYEAFASQQGVDPSNIDAQLDFLMSELAGPEANAYQAIMSAPDSGSAAAAIVNQFLRPSEEHRARREAAYLGGATTPWVGSASPAGGAANPSVAQLLSLAGNEWANPGQSSVISALLNQQMQQQDPRYQQQLAMGDLDMQRAQLELQALQNPTAPKPIEVGGVLLDPTTFEPIFDSRTPSENGFTLSPGQQRFGPDGIPIASVPENASGADPAREQQISRMMETGIDRNTAINIVDGRWKMDTNPITGRPQITDMATGQPAHTQQAPTPSPAPGMQSQANPAVMQDFGTQFPSSNEAFGVGGAAMGALNTIGDATGFGAPYPEVQQTQADFAVLQERLLNDIAGSYGRQPPSWLLQRIDELTPKAGNPMEGSSGAINKLNSLGRDIQTELGIARERLNRELTPTTREETETTIAGLEAALARIGTASKSFGAQQQSDTTPAPEGVPADLWQVMTPEERALWQQ